MQIVALWVCLWCAVWCAGSSSVPKCTSPSSYKFTLTSSRNQTGHWIAQVKLEHGAAEGEIGPWEASIDHTTTQCNGSQSLLVVATVVAPPAVRKPEIPKPPPEGYRKFGSTYHKLHPEPKKWIDARQACEQEGATLAVINSEAEAKFITLIWNSASEIAYIGIHDLYMEGEYITINNETLSAAGYSKWSEGEPNGGTTENCGVIVRTALLGNYFCHIPLPFICEFH